MTSQFVFASGAALLVVLPVSLHTGQESEEPASLAALDGGLLWEGGDRLLSGETWDSMLLFASPYSFALLLPSDLMTSGHSLLPDRSFPRTKHSSLKREHFLCDITQ